MTKRSKNWRKNISATRNLRKLMAVVHRSKNTGSSSKEECQPGSALRMHTRVTQTSNVINHYPRPSETGKHWEFRKKIHHNKLRLLKVERNRL